MFYETELIPAIKKPSHYNGRFHLVCEGFPYLHPARLSSGSATIFVSFSLDILGVLGIESARPHHLKNKRVQHGVLDKQTTELLANAMKKQELQTKQVVVTTVTSPIEEAPELIAEATNEHSIGAPFESSLSPIPPSSQASTPIPVQMHEGECL